jgi:hypothetical protein
MARYVHASVMNHPELEPLARARQRWQVHAHERAIWIAAVREPAHGGWEIEARIERPEWWRPSTRANGDAIVAELVSGILLEWECRARSEGG